jgi:hypothetical protein
LTSAARWCPSSDGCTHNWPARDRPVRSADDRPGPPGAASYCEWDALACRRRDSSSDLHSPRSNLSC